MALDTTKFIATCRSTRTAMTKTMAALQSIRKEAPEP